MKEIIGAQGEVTIIRIDAVPDVETKPMTERATKGAIISHSETGHHHCLTGGDVMERVDPPAGMRVLYAILDEPGELVQDAPVPHDGYKLDAGVYEFRIAREHDPFTEQARIVAD